MGLRYPLIRSVSFLSPATTLSHSPITVATLVGQSETADMSSRVPSSIRLAISISPSRVSSSTEPISRMYMRTGSVVRCCSDSTEASAAAASAAATSSGVLSPFIMSSVSASGAVSNTVIPMSLII